MFKICFLLLSPLFKYPGNKIKQFFLSPIYLFKGIIKDTERSGTHIKVGEIQVRAARFSF